MKQNNYKEIYIFTGGNLDKQILSNIDISNKLIIGVDYGIEWLFNQNIVPDYFVGDFDSIDVNLLNKLNKDYKQRIIKYSVNKDETDTELALRYAITFDPDLITIVGGIGSRIDHVIANINILLQAERANIKAIIYDIKNRIQLLLPGKSCLIEKSIYKYISLIPFSESVEGINLIGFKYPLYDSTMKLGFPYGISNELISERGCISIKKGVLLVIESND